MKKAKPKVGRPKSDTPRRAPLYVRNDYHLLARELSRLRQIPLCEIIEAFLRSEFKSAGISVT